MTRPSLSRADAVMVVDIWDEVDADTTTVGAEVVIGAGAKLRPLRSTQMKIHQEIVMKSIVFTVLSAVTLLSSAAIAAPLNPTTAGSQETSAAEQVRLVFDEYGRCYRSRGRRYVQRGYDDDYSGRQSYGYCGGGQRYYGGNQGYYGGDQGHYGGGPSIGFSFGNRGW